MPLWQKKSPTTKCFQICNGISGRISTRFGIKRQFFFKSDSDNYPQEEYKRNKIMSKLELTIQIKKSTSIRIILTSLDKSISR